MDTQPSSSSTTTTNSDNSQSSTDTTMPDSLLSFEFSLDPSDPLNFLMSGGGSDELSVDSSLEDTSSSSHGSPPEWQAMWNQSLNNSPRVPKKERYFDEQTHLQWSDGLPQLSFDGAQMELDCILPDSTMPASGHEGMQFDPAIFAEAALSLGFDLSQVQSTAASPHDILSTPLLYPYEYSGDAFNSSSLLSATGSAGLRRLSVTSSSSSGASFSPDPEGEAGHPSLETQSTSDQQRASSGESFDDLVQRTLMATGVRSAIDTSSGPIVSSNVTTHQANPSGKLPIPRLTRLAPSQVKPKSGSSVPITVASTPSSSPPPSCQQQIMATNPRPKTSHTTIERRYRTNLNARIQSLRAAVPALRVLEQKDGNKVGNLNLKAGIRRADEPVNGENEELDIIDSRGFVDGVKVARKGSKANVLGKAVEYIRVLKKREMRLKREQDGLRSLIKGLVGGAALLKEWESEWVKRYGGPERDEVEGEGEDDEDDDDEEDADGEDGDSGKKRKRAKVEGSSAIKSVAPAAKKASNPTIDPVSGEPIPKRGRGRPRKVAPAPTVPSMPLVPVGASSEVPLSAQQIHFPPPQIQITSEADSTLERHQHIQPAQYMLAVFALFSFFSSPVTYPSSFRYTPEHTHMGAVLGSNADTQSPPTAQQAHAFGSWGYVASPTLGWRDVIQLCHLVVSFLLLVSVVGPWLPHIWSKRIMRVVPSALQPLLLILVPNATHSSESAEVDKSDGSLQDGKDVEREDARSRLALMDALRLRYIKDQDIMTQDQEMQALRDALGVHDGVGGLISAVALVFGRSSVVKVGTDGLERKMLEQRAWIRIAELVALDAHAPLTTRLQTYLCTSKYLSLFTASAVDLSTLALVVNPFWQLKSESLWELARKRANDKVVHGSQVCKPFEKLVLEDLSIDVAASMISSLSAEHIAASSSVLSPLALLAQQIVREHIRKHAEQAFLRNVLGEGHEDMSGKTEGEQDADMRRIVAAGMSLDSSMVEITELYQTACNPSWSHLSHSKESNAAYEDINKIAENTRDSDICALLMATVLYRRVFPSTILHLPLGDSFSSSCENGISSMSICLTPMLSPPPSPKHMLRKRSPSRAALRVVLDSEAFNRGDALEDARDRVVDILTSDRN